jgi:hypothetical protein
MTIIPGLFDLVIEHVSLTTEVTITVGAASPTAACPCCGTYTGYMYYPFENKEGKSCLENIASDMEKEEKIV